jgi:hypothetical protein
MLGGLMKSWAGATQLFVLLAMAQLMTPFPRHNWREKQLGAVLSFSLALDICGYEIVA